MTVNFMVRFFVTLACMDKEKRIQFLRTLTPCEMREFYAFLQLIQEGVEDLILRVGGIL